MSGIMLKYHYKRLKCSDSASDEYSPNSAWLVTSPHDTTRHVRRVEPMHLGCVELVEQHGSTRSTRRSRLARHVT